MIKIAHRGNTNGPSIYENQPWYVKSAIDRGFDVEVDIWRIGKSLWLGHDSAMYLIGEDFLNEHRGALWLHCKNLEALEYLASFDKHFNFFWHENDSYTLTSYGYIWTYPGKKVGDMSVIVDLEGRTEYNCYATCSDYISEEA